MDHLILDFSHTRELSQQPFSGLCDSSRLNTKSLEKKVTRAAKMSSTFSFVAVKPCNIREGNGINFMYQKSIKLSTTRAELTLVAPIKQTSIPVFPELTKAGIPLTHLRIQEVVKRQSQVHSSAIEDQARRKPQFHPSFLEEAYERCRVICKEYAKSFYLGTIPHPLSPFYKHYFYLSTFHVLFSESLDYSLAVTIVSILIFM